MIAGAMVLDLLRGDDPRVHRKPHSARTSFAIDLVHIGEGNARFVLAVPLRGVELPRREHTRSRPTRRGATT